MRIAVTGSNGQLGCDVTEAFEAQGDELHPLTHADIEITDVHSVYQVLEKIRPDVLVNTAAFHNVEQCENEPIEAFRGNAYGAWNLAKAARDLDFLLIHVGTDYVFDGAKGEPYVETDRPCPLNAYGNTKLAGDHFVATTAPKHLVMRSSGLYGANPCRAKGGRNFVQTMLKLARERDEVRVVDNEILTPTSTKALAQQIAKASRTEAYGICHATAEGSCSWYDFAGAIFEIAGMDVNLNVASPEEFPVKVPRPNYSVLENKFLKDHGMNVLGHWREGLEAYLMETELASQ